jgi:LAO/AO transport system kinase
VVRAVATTGDGVEDLWQAIESHRSHLEATGELERRRQARLRDELELVVQQRLRAEAERRMGAAGRAELERELLARRIDPWQAAARIVGEG